MVIHHFLRDRFTTFCRLCMFQEVAELVHKVHLLCLLARGRFIDAACDDPLIQVVSLYNFFFGFGSMF